MSTSERRSTFRVLRHPGLLRFLTGRVMSLLGSSMAPLAIAFAILDHSGTATQVGEVLAAQSVPLVAFLVFGGSAADRWGRRRVMVIADLLRAVAQASLAAWVISGHPPLVAFAAAEAVIGVGQATFGPAVTGLVPELVADPSDLQAANSLRGLANSLATVAGPALAGIVVAAVNPGWAIAVDAATYLASVLQVLDLPGKGKVLGAVGKHGNIMTGSRSLYGRSAGSL
jgi:MFS family permease